MRINVLYAEDTRTCYKVVSRFIMQAIQNYLSDISEEVEIDLTVAKSSTEAYSFLQDNPADYFSIFFMDNNLGFGPFGMEIIKCLPGFGYDMSKVVIAAVSGDLQESKLEHAESIAIARDLGYSYFLPKPTFAPDVKEAVNVMLPSVIERLKEENKKNKENTAEHEREVVVFEEAETIAQVTSMMQMGSIGEEVADGIAG